MQLLKKKQKKSQASYRSLTAKRSKRKVLPITNVAAISGNRTRANHLIVQVYTEHNYIGLLLWLSLISARLTEYAKAKK